MNKTEIKYYRKLFEDAREIRTRAKLGGLTDITDVMKMIQLKEFSENIQSLEKEISKINKGLTALKKEK